MSHKLVVLVVGVHEAGKGNLRKMLAPMIEAEQATASSLIRKKRALASAISISCINSNQSVLVEEFRFPNSLKNSVFLDGHFCLFDSELRIQWLMIN